MSKTKYGSCIAFAIGLFFIFMMYMSLRDNLALNSVNDSSVAVSHPMNGIVLCLLVCMVALYNKEPINRNQLIVLCLFIIGQGFAILYNNNFLPYVNTRYSLAVSFVLEFLLFISFPYNICFSTTTISRLIDTIIGIGLFCCLYQFFVYKNTNFFLKPTFDFQAFFNSRNTFGNLLALCVILCFYQLHKTKNKIVYILILFFLLTNLVATLSRDSYLMVAIMLVVYYFISNRHKLFVAFIAAIFMVCGIFIIRQNDFLQNFVSNYMIRYDAGLNGRNSLWAIAFSRIDVPTFLFGQGFGSPLFVLHYYSLIDQHSFHNNYIDMIYSGGLLYYIVYIYIISITIKKVSILWTLDRTSARFFIASMIAIFVYGCFEVYLPFFLDQNCIIETFVLFTLPIMVSNSKIQSAWTEIHPLSEQGPASGRLYQNICCP